MAEVDPDNSYEDFGKGKEELWEFFTSAGHPGLLKEKPRRAAMPFGVMLFTGRQGNGAA